MAPRKSTRVVKQVLKVDRDGDYDSDGGGGPEQSEGEQEFDQARQTKKNQTTGKKGKGKSAGTSGGASSEKKKNKNKLEVFNSMPLDVLVEIMAQSDPKTLLAMSRTCSIFRQVLHSEGGLSAWKSARRNVGLGQLKRRDVKEWEIAQLLFDGTCVVCGKSRAVTVDYVLFVRGCAKCMRANSKRREGLEESVYHDRAFDVVPCSLWTPYDDATPMKFFWKPMLARVTNELKSLEDKPVEFKAFLKARKHIQKEATADARILEDWVERAKRDASRAIDDKRGARFEKIKENLRLEGYDERDLLSHALSIHPDVNNARELSENVWNRIKPVITSLFDEERSQRLAQEATQRQRSRAFALKHFYRQIETSLPPSSSSDLRTYFPPFSNFLSLPSVQALYVPEGFVPTSEDLSSARPQILREIQAFATDLQTAFASNLVSAYTALDPTFNSDSTPLSKTSCLSAIKCPSLRCQTYSTFPPILEHARICCGDHQVITEDSLSTTPLRIYTINLLIQAVNQDDPRVGSTKLSESSSVAELYALGNTFECCTCEEDKNQGVSGGALGVATWSRAYQTNQLGWVSLLEHVQSKHSHGTGFKIKYTRALPPPPADPQTLGKGSNDDDDEEPDHVEH